MLVEAQATVLELPFALEMLGVVVGAVGGALTACERKLDIVGGVALGMVFFHEPVVRHPNAVEWLNILGVALFAAAGADKAIVFGLSPATVLLMGVLTGNDGGLLRDIVLGDVPKMFQKGNWYALCSLFGSLAYWLCVVSLGWQKGVVGTLAVIATIALRRASLHFNIQSPADVDLTPRVRESIECASRDELAKTNSLRS